MLSALGRPTTLVFTQSISSSRRLYSSHRRDRDLDETKLAAARQWLARLDAETIPRSVGEVTFSRSSGPGGQNVNKVSSKATLRVPLASILSLIPELLHAPVRTSRYVAPRSEEIVIQADEARKQLDNVNACYRKLNDMLKDAADEAIPGETSAEQSARVKQLQKSEEIARRRMKDFRSQKKAMRRSPQD